jgi:hypothetical protein
MDHYDDAFTKDLESRLADVELMDKYHISAAELRKRLFELIRQGAVRSGGVYWRPIIYDYEVENEARRTTPRYALKTLLPVAPVDFELAKTAFLVDISENGGRVVGLGARKGERITLAIDTKDLLEAPEIRLEAFFRWVEEGDDLDASAAGFEIFAISPKDFVLLHELIRVITA